MRIKRSISIVFMTIMTIVACDEDEKVNSIPKVDNQVFEVFENINDLEIIGNVVATDEDDDNLIFTIKENDEDLFELSEEGELSLFAEKQLDFESKVAHSIIVEVSDGKESSTGTIIINVKDIDENQGPLIKNQSFTVPESIGDGESIGKVEASDPDNDKLQFTVLESELFEITQDGTLSLISGKELDYETQTTHKFLVQVSDSKEVRSAEITINVTDVNENNPPVIENQTFSVAENISADEVIGTVIASDPDGDILSYSVVDNMLFEITSEGKLSLVSGKELDYETTQQHIVVIRVTDEDKYAEAEITINVTDVEEGNTVSITDEKFLAELLNNHNIDTNGNSKIEISEAESYSGIVSVGGLGINDLKGIESFHNITKLFFQNNNISSVDLSNNTQLKVIYSYGNPLVSLNLSQNTLLEDLRCSNNSLNNLDLTKNVNLKILVADNNDLGSVDLTKNVLLENLSLSENKLSSIDFSHNINIKNIYLPKNNLTSLDASNLPKLGSLNCQDNQLTSIDVNNSTEIKSLVLINNSLQMIDISTNLNLDYIALRSNNLESLDFSKNENLRVVNVELNALETVMTANSEALKELYLSNNQITSIDVSQNTSLQVLSMPNNKLVGLDLSNNPSLTSVQLTQNNLEKVNIANGNNGNIQSFNARFNDNLSCVQIDTNFIIDLNMGIWSVNPEVTSFSYSPCN